MATIKRTASRYGQFGGVSPYGNLTVLTFLLATNATGQVTDSDATAALAVGDVIDLGELPEGMRLDDAQALITTPMTASVTGKLGFKYSDGVDVPAVPQDDDYFLAAASLATAGRKRADGSTLVTLPKPARLILTIGGAANTQASDIKITVTGELTGPK